MMNLVSKTLFLLSLLFSAFSLQANQTSKMVGDYEINYVAFPSTFIQASVAKQLQLERSDEVAIVNISTLLVKNGLRIPKSATVTGTAKNLVGNIKELTFIKVDEGDAIYYLAQVSHRNQETLNFTIDVVLENKRRETLKFKKVFYIQ